MSRKKAIQIIANKLLDLNWKEERDELIWLLSKAYGEDKVKELLNDYSDLIQDTSLYASSGGEK